MQIISNTRQHQRVIANITIVLLNITFERNIFFKKDDEMSRCFHSHKKRKDSMQTQAVWLVFSLELEMSGGKVS